MVFIVIYVITVIESIIHLSITTSKANFQNDYDHEYIDLDIRIDEITEGLRDFVRNQLRHTDGELTD